MAAEVTPVGMAAHKVGSKVGGATVPGTSAPLIPIMMIGLGAYLAWFGVSYWRSDVRWPTDPVKALLTGKPLPARQQVLPDAAQPNGVTSFTINALTQFNGQYAAQKAATYIGAGYVYGGPADKPGDWDCSSFVSKVLGQDMSMILPGGGKWGDPGYPPHSHGPGSTQYMLYGTGVELADVQPGDLVVSVEHIGIITGPGTMISAMDPTRGTGKGTFPGGFPAGPPVYRRPAYQGASNLTPIQGPPVPQPSGTAPSTTKPTGPASPTPSGSPAGP